MVLTEAAAAAAGFAWVVAVAERMAQLHFVGWVPVAIDSYTTVAALCILRIRPRLEWPGVAVLAVVQMGCQCSVAVVGMLRMGSVDCTLSPGAAAGTLSAGGRMVAAAVAGSSAAGIQFVGTASKLVDSLAVGSARWSRKNRSDPKVAASGVQIAWAG